MTRWVTAVFAVVVAATVGAVFLTQHLKITVPLIQGEPNPVPTDFNPVAGRVCTTRSGQRVDFKKTWISFTLENSDTVDAYIFNSAGRLVQTVKTGVRIAAQARSPRFYWGGRNSSGNYVPAGTYYWRFVLERENRTIALTQTPITVIRKAPQPKITSVSLSRAGGGGVVAAAGPAIITPRKQSATIRFTKADYRQVVVKLWRTDSGRPRLAGQYTLGNPTLGRAQWNGVLHGRDVPAGTYQVTVQVQDQACNQGTYPIAQPPVIPVANTGVTVRYLAVQPPLGPVPAGSRATVFVDSRLQPYRWSLRAVGGRVVGHGREPHGALRLKVRLPRRQAGLYELTVRSGRHTSTVPLLASATGGAGGRVLVVLPMLTWQGLNQVDDTGGGLPDTLAANDPIQLQRPLASGLPPGFGGEAALLRYLTATRRHFQLTTDVALAEGAGPSLSGHRGVILDGPFRWLPANLVSELRAYARAGGRVLSLGVRSLQGQAPLQRSGGGTLTAGPPAPLSPDPFGAHHGPVSTTAGEIIAEQSDPLRIFSVTLALTGFPRFQTINPPDGVRASTAGVAAEAPAIVGFRSGTGRVVEIGLPRFQSSLRHNVASQQLLGRIWTLLSS